MDGSIYRAPPSPEVDAAWNRVADLRPTWITTEDVIKLGKGSPHFYPLPFHIKLILP